MKFEKSFLTVLMIDACQSWHETKILFDFLSTVAWNQRIEPFVDNKNNAKKRQTKFSTAMKFVSAEYKKKNTSNHPLIKESQVKMSDVVHP